MGSSRAQHTLTAIIPSRSRQMTIDFIAPGAITVSPLSTASQASLASVYTSTQIKPTLPSLAQYCQELASLEATPSSRPHSPSSAKTSRTRSLLASSAPIGALSIRRPHAHTHLYHPYSASCPSPPSSSQSICSHSSKSRSSSPQFPHPENSIRTPAAERMNPHSKFSATATFSSTPKPSATSDASRYRAERVGYDLEEKFALVWLRITTERSWKHIKHGIDLLFPPGQVRRVTAPLGNSKVLPRNYPDRSIGGLECRYYRVREKAGMKKVRDGRRQTADTETEALESMERELVEHWVETTGASALRSFGLEQKHGDEDESWWTRAGTAYHAETAFWTQLMEVGDVVRAQE